MTPGQGHGFGEKPFGSSELARGRDHLDARCAARIAVRLDEGRAVSFDPSRYPSIAHGYAVTVHKAQGATIDRVYTLADPIMNRHAAYVALTRHREGVHLFADRESFPSRAQLDRALSRDG